MDSDLQITWSNIAANWDKWKAPLRPSAEDVSIIQQKIASWKTDNSLAKILLLGVTPELANMEYSFPTELTAMDINSEMIKHVWPGDNENRKALLGDWMTSELPASQDIVLADGSFIFFNAFGMKELTKRISQSLKQNGLFIARHFAKNVTNDSLSMITKELIEGKITNFHEFKFRVAMALQPNFHEGVTQKRIFDEAQKIIKSTRTNLFSEEDLSTLYVYERRETKHYFPTVAQLTIMFKQEFENVDVVFPTYEFGQRCPIITCSGRKS